ncbi:LptF/LptG family permease [Terrimonas sp. NA20]|uniref:LptF/LptG family permease n=1 Tax=Terrimonas ginsenosidimutans TaxID=2908004 RepID=A0ABS9KR01_9BACT|nr:LptF/LptG family permease [Terrimonas ginsenosidimutans]MCG2614715.1 LptF/LptG family permease [Terrimonas ginsenosidimutans]
MFKKLDKLIIKAFIGPFIATFFITLMVLVMQFFWLYIDDFVGKGLGVDVVLKFIWYQSAVLVPLALPLAVLLSSLMTFGNLGESFELVAIKSAGISLLRFMRPLLIISIFISILAFLFSNYVIPVAYLKSRTMLSDIVWAKPAFDLKEGVFYDRMNGFAIKIGEKEKNDSVIRDVIVYEQQQNGLQDNFVIARSGIMRVSADKRFLEFNLKDGWRYQEKGNNPNSAKNDYIRLGFKEYNKQFDISSMLPTFTNDSSNRNNEKFYSMRQLNRAIDSLKKENAFIKNNLEKGLYLSFLFNRYLDSTSAKKNPGDSAFQAAKTLDELLPDSARYTVAQQAIGEASSMSASINAADMNMTERDKQYRKHQIEWHRKIVLSVACVVLFLIGAPLGSIIRKGGLGTPLIAAICFFMVFYFSTTVGEKFAKEGQWSTFSGMWLAIFVLLPIGFFLIYKAMRDSQLFNKEAYTRLFRAIANFFRRFKPATGRNISN